MSILILEDGTGVTKANTYQTVQQAIDRLDAFGYTAFKDLADVDAQERALVRGTTKLDRGLRSADVKGWPKVDTQGLYCPRDWPPTWDYVAIPEEIILASALRAELIAVESSGEAGYYAGLPDGVTQVRLSEDAGFTKSPGKVEVRAASEIRDEIYDLIESLYTRPTTSNVYTCGVYT